MYITNRHLSRRTVLKGMCVQWRCAARGYGACPARTRGGGRQEGSARRYRDGALVRPASTAIGIKEEPVDACRDRRAIRLGPDESRLTPNRSATISPSSAHLT